MGTKPSESVEAKEVIVRGEVLRQLYNIMGGLFDYVKIVRQMWCHRIDLNHFYLFSHSWETTKSFYQMIYIL